MIPKARVLPVGHRIGRAAWIRFHAAMAQNQDGRFTRNTRDLAGHEFVENKIAQHADCLPRKQRDDIEQAREVHAAVFPARPIGRRFSAAA
jgi:hypothetical protein